MRPLGLLPSFPPRPPLPGESLLGEREEEFEETTGNLDEEFTNQMEQEGYGNDLIKMGLKVMRNHMRPKGEAFQIGANYIKEMNK